MNDCEIGPAKLHRYSPRLTDNEKTGRKDYEGMAHHPSGGYVLYSEHVNILQRLAEQAAEIERLDTECRDRIRQALENGQNYHAAERAKQEACGLLREVIDDLGGVGCYPCVGSHSPFEDIAGRIVNFLTEK